MTVEIERLLILIRARLPDADAGGCAGLAHFRVLLEGSPQRPGEEDREALGGASIAELEPAVPGFGKQVVGGSAAHGFGFSQKALSARRPRRR